MFGNRSLPTSFPHKLPTKTNDIAPMIFFIDIISSENFFNPIVPVPVRIDKVTNGQNTLIIAPEQLPYIEHPTEKDKIITFNLEKFYHFALSNLLNYSIKKFKQICYKEPEKIHLEKWLDLTIKNTGKILTFQEDQEFLMQTFLESYVKNIKGENEIECLKWYCDRCIDYFNKRIDQNNIEYILKGKLTSKRLYFTKKGKKHPDIIELDQIDLTNNKAKRKVFVPILIYDDILECFLSNRLELDKNEKNIYTFFEISKNIIEVKEKTFYNNIHEQLITQENFMKLLNKIKSNEFLNKGVGKGWEKI